VLKNVEIKSEATRFLKNKILNIKDCPERAEALLFELKEDKKNSDCSKCDSRHFCSLFLACIYFELDELNQTKFHIQEAIEDFHQVGSKWNELLAIWIYGKTLLILGDMLPARRELERTIELLQGRAEKFQREHNYEKRDECNIFIGKIKTQLDQPLEVQKQRKQAQDQKDKKQGLLSHRQPRYPHWRRSQLIFPVQSQITAGPEGNFIFESQPDIDATLDELAFNEVLHYIYNIRDEGNSIILKPRVYRWFRVEGNSMNRTSPIPIQNNDYALAIDLKLSNMSAQPGDVIIASIKNPAPNERSGVIKRYSKAGLESLSTEDYPIIPLSTVSIRGLAIAIAKPAQALG
nr:hypothetical protein [Candidatus Desulfolinea nitratireducens]